MGKALLFIALALYASGTNADPWGREDAYWEVGFQVINWVDWKQTIHVSEHPEKYREVTSEKYIGAHPTAEALNILMLFNAVGHGLVSAMLDAPWRRRWQCVTLVYKADPVVGNIMLGITVPF